MYTLEQLREAAWHSWLECCALTEGHIDYVDRYQEEELFEVHWLHYLRKLKEDGKSSDSLPEATV